MTEIREIFQLNKKQRKEEGEFFIQKYHEQIFEKEIDYMHNLFMNMSLFNKRSIALIKNTHFD